MPRALFGNPSTVGLLFIGNGRANERSYPRHHCRFTANLHVPSEDVSLARSTGALLTIVETTSFKQINHLTLRFPPVPEAVLNRHFQNIVKDLTVCRAAMGRTTVLIVLGGARAPAAAAHAAPLFGCSREG